MAAAGLLNFSGLKAESDLKKMARNVRWEVRAGTVRVYFKEVGRLVDRAQLRGKSSPRTRAPDMRGNRSLRQLGIPVDHVLPFCSFPTRDAAVMLVSETNNKFTPRFALVRASQSGRGCSAQRRDAAARRAPKGCTKYPFDHDR